MRVEMNRAFATARREYIGPLLISLVAAFIFVSYWQTYVAIIAGDSGPEKYSHRAFVLPIFFVAIWSIREKFTALPVKACWLGLIPLLACGAAWLVGELALIQSLKNLAAILLIPMAVLTILGYQWAATASFPLFFLVFAVPLFGPIVPLLVDMTAAFTFVALQWSGILVFREGPYFELSTGRWSIVDACSGTEYLGAVLMFAMLFAWTVFDDTRKRIQFVAGAVVVGIVGNWVRAYLTMLIAHVSNNQYLREDHGSFGWYLFATLLFLYCLAGWQFRDPGPDNIARLATKTVSDERREGRLPISTMTIFIAILALISIVVWPAVHSILSHSIRVERAIALPRIQASGNWIEATPAQGDWVPALVNPTIQGMQTFVGPSGGVTLHIGVFANENSRSKLVTSVNKFVDSDSRNWSQVSNGRTLMTITGTEISPKTGVIIGGGRRIIAWQWYWLNGRTTGGDIQAKVWQLAGKLRGKADLGVWLAVSTYASGEDSTAEQLLRDFTRDLGPEIFKTLDAFARQ